jgi:uncharacterized protein (DUF362 family)
MLQPHDDIYEAAPPKFGVQSVLRTATMNRREFLERSLAFGGAAAAVRVCGGLAALRAQTPSRVAFVKTTNRADGVRRALALLNPAAFGGRDVFLKPNFNSADPTPGSTHVETLDALVGELRRLGAGPVTLGDRSGMGHTREVMQHKDIPALARDLKIRLVVLDELPAAEWEPVRTADSHWQRGFAFPRMVKQAGAVVQTCCLKTHRFGGHFTLSLKNSVGLAAKQVPGDSYDYMTELHRSPDQRRMIAEINQAYAPAFVVLDGVQAFTTAGPEAGTIVDAGVVLAAADRVALDAVGVAILRHFGTTPEVMKGAVFEQEQIARAAQLGLGASGPGHIQIVTGDPESERYAATIRALLT